MASQSSDSRDDKTSSDLTSVDPQEGESRLHRWQLRLAFALPVLILCVGWLLASAREDLPSQIDLFTGSEQGTYHGIGKALKDSLTGRLGEGEDKVELLLKVTDGSSDNQDLVGESEAALGFVQNNAEGRGDLRTIAKLYKEVLQIVVRKGSGQADLEGLIGLRIGLGPDGSGTHKLMEKIFSHYEVQAGSYTAVHADFKESVAKFLAGELDAVIFLTGIPNDAVATLFRESEVELLSLDLDPSPGSILEGLCRGMPGVHPAVIPAHAYGSFPSGPIGTVSVDALLVTHREMSNRLVRDITSLLFENRLRVGQQQAAILEMEEIKDSSGVRFPLHPGAASYYARDEPPFFVTYAEPLSLGLTLLLSLGSSVLAFREWRRRARKNRIDGYYLQVEKLAKGLSRGQLSFDDLQDLREELLKLRRGAFRELVAEKLEANEAFTIFQTLVNNRILEVDQALAAALRDPAGPPPHLNPS